MHKLLLKNKYPLVVILIFICICAGWMAYAADPPAKIPSKPAPEKKPSINSFTYTAQDRRDPFEPLYLLKAKKSREGLLAKAKKGGTEKPGYELEELKLVGIIKKNKERYAMMEDVSGRGILYKKGDPINPTTSIIDILESKVIFGYRVKGEMKKFEMEIQK